MEFCGQLVPLFFFAGQLVKYSLPFRGQDIAAFEQAEQEQEEKDRLEEVMEAAQEKEPSRAMQLIRTAPYFIRQGDSLRSIATRFFRNPSYWRYLARLNGYQGDLLTLGLGGLKIPVSATEMLLLKEVVNLIEKRMPVLATYDGGGRGRRKA